MNTVNLIARFPKHKLEVLMDKLGLLETTRFLALKSSAEKYDDSVKWHQEWQAQLDKEAFFDEVFK